MKKVFNSKTQNGLDGLICAAITLALIIGCFLFTSACMAQDSICKARDTISIDRMVPITDDTTNLPLQVGQIMVSADLDNYFWDTETIHVKGVDIGSLPDTINVVLVDSLHGFSIPYPGNVCSRFKYRGRHAHKGVDIPLKIGDGVCAAFDGVVRVTRVSRRSGGYGNLVVIRHFNGLETYYAHLSKSLVHSGDTVAAGDLIGYGGNTGRSTGPHLHFETRYKGHAFDPERIIDFKNRTLRVEVIALKKHYFSCHSQYGMTDQQSLAFYNHPPKITPSPKYYKVQRGDSLTRIAQRQGTTVKNICKLNGIKENKYIYVGQRLRIK